MASGKAIFRRIPRLVLRGGKSGKCLCVCFNGIFIYIQLHILRCMVYTGARARDIYVAAEWSDAVAITKLQQELDFAYCVCMSVFVFSVQILGGQRPQDCHSSTCTAPINIRRRECNSASFSFGTPYC